MKAVIAVLLLLPGIAVAQSEPNLQATVDFMDQMVRPEGRQLALVSNCEVSIVSRHKVQIWLYRSASRGFLLGDDTGIKDEDEAPFPRYEKFNLADVDPTTIGSMSGGFSDAYMRKFSDEYPACKDHISDTCNAQMLRSFAMERSDMTAAYFHTADLKPAIERGVQTKVDDPADPRNRAGYILYSNSPRQHTDRTGFSFGDQDRAQRFVTALIHAVKLCGGRGSLFAPTPENR